MDDMANSKILSSQKENAGQAGVKNIDPTRSHQDTDKNNVGITPQFKSACQFDRFPIHQTPPIYSRQYFLFIELMQEQVNFSISDTRTMLVQVLEAVDGVHAGRRLGAYRIPEAYGPHLWRLQAEVYFFFKFLRSAHRQRVRWYMNVLDQFATELLKFQSPHYFGTTWRSSILSPIICRFMYSLPDDDVERQILFLTFLATQRTGEEVPIGEFTTEDLHTLYTKRDFLLAKYNNGMFFAQLGTCPVMLM